MELPLTASKWVSRFFAFSPLSAASPFFADRPSVCSQYLWFRSACDLFHPREQGCVGRGSLPFRLPPFPLLNFQLPFTDGRRILRNLHCLPRATLPSSQQHQFDLQVRFSFISSFSPSSLPSLPSLPSFSFRRNSLLTPRVQANHVLPCRH
jgi:hypothetical protein